MDNAMSNSILKLKGPFKQKKNSSRPGPPSLPAHSELSSNRVRAIRDTLIDVAQYWKRRPAAHKPLVAIRYNRIIPKSGRVQRLLSENDSASSNDTIVGAKFENTGSEHRHVITHCISLEAIDRSIHELSLLADCIDIICPSSTLTSDHLNLINKEKRDFSSLPLARTTFSRLAADAINIDRFMLNKPDSNIPENSLVTLYQGAVKDNVEFLRSIGIPEFNLRTFDGSTFLLTPDQYRLLYKEAPQLIAMSLSDLNEIPEEHCEDAAMDTYSIPSPTNEPWVGVLDTPFNTDVYFSEWVESSIQVNKDLITTSDFMHGTCVTSIVVDGPTLNPMLDDGCGRFRVRHIGIAVGKKFSSFTIIREIEKAVIRYPEIKVWNLSLGAVLEIPENFISAEAAALDRIQTEHDVIFIIAGTNDRERSGKRRLGSPADSLNSLVVNSVRLDGNPCSYSRRGPVLSFFGKPDVSYYGGDHDQPMTVCCEPNKNRLVCGTSYAAPWIARKMAYLIHIAGFERETAKALIIDSACGWAPSTSPTTIGYGIVPKRIEEILSTPDDEIKFILSSTSELFDTYSYDIPVPVSQGGHPYYAKATLCYFPHCERNQGVDYTSTELSLSFGRLKDEKIQPIDNNVQDLAGSFTYEEEARKFFRKWDNVKHISEIIKQHGRSKKSYGDGFWGISIKTKERLEKRYGEGIRFGLVITLHAIDGVNRIDEFIQRCSFRSWIVSKVDIEKQIEIFNQADQEIEFE